MFKKIIAATDRVTVPDAPVLTGIRIAESYGARINILHVLESASTANRLAVRHFHTGQNISVTPVYVDQVESKIRQTYERFLKTDIQTEVLVCTGYPWEEILRRSKRFDADLVALGPHSNRALKKGLVRSPHRMGSTVQDVVARETCPVMIVSESGKAVQPDFKKIVVGIDFSVASECALCFSARMARTIGAKVYPFFMIPVMPYPKFTRQQHESNRKTQAEKLKNFCDFYLDGTPHEYIIKSGMFPHLEIVKYAVQTSADLIALGSHTRIKSGKWYAGSVVENVSQEAECPVLVVSDPDALHPWEEMQPPIKGKISIADRDLHMFDAAPAAGPSSARV